MIASKLRAGLRGAVISGLLVTGAALAPATPAQAAGGNTIYCYSPGTYTNTSWSTSCFGGRLADQVRATVVCTRAGHTTVTVNGPWTHASGDASHATQIAAACPGGYDPSGHPSYSPAK